LNLRKTNQEGKNERKPLLYVDGTYLKFRRGGVVEKKGGEEGKIWRRKN